MMIRAITATTPACYGVCCPRRKDCQRYAAVETSSQEDTVTTCEDGAGERPLFVEQKAKEA